MAELSLEKNALMTAYNRIYYAIFYTVTALAEIYDFKTSKHSAMLGWFNKKFIYEENIFKPEIFDIYNTAFQFRQKGDYDTMYKLDKEEAVKMLAEAKIFVKTVREEIQDHELGRLHSNS